MSTAAPYLQLLPNPQTRAQATNPQIGRLSRRPRQRLADACSISKHPEDRITGIYESSPAEIYAALLDRLPGMPIEGLTPETIAPASWSVAEGHSLARITVTSPESGEPDIALHCLIGQESTGGTTVTFVPSAERRSVWRRTSREMAVERRCQALAAQATTTIMRFAHDAALHGADRTFPRRGALRLVEAASA